MNPFCEINMRSNKHYTEYLKFSTQTFGETLCNKKYPCHQNYNKYYYYEEEEQEQYALSLQELGLAFYHILFPRDINSRMHVISFCLPLPWN